ncbi:hypothetical protein TNCV_2948791 [Trichonephila clavipes]|nr:hypothetical protein TNCV_2948791 [Trichonephila clavipes]
MTSYIRLNDSLRYRGTTELESRLEAGQSQAEVTLSLQEARKWCCGINSKQVVLSRGRSANVTTEHQNLHRCTRA